MNEYLFCLTNKQTKQNKNSHCTNNIPPVNAFPTANDHITLVKRRKPNSRIVQDGDRAGMSGERSAIRLAKAEKYVI